MAKEAYVSIKEVLKDAPALSSVATPFLVAGCIKAPYGDFKVNYFDSRKAFLDKYTVDGKLTGKCDVSLVNAYEVLGSAPILVARAADLEYDGYKVLVNQEESNPDSYTFAIQFNDFMCDGVHKVKYSLVKSTDNPGAVKFTCKYLTKMNMYKYDLVEIEDGGTGYSIGDIVTLVNGTITIKARVLDVSANGTITAMKFLTSVGANSVEGFSLSGSPDYAETPIATGLVDNLSSYVDDTRIQVNGTDLPSGKNLKSISINWEAIDETTDEREYTILLSNDGTNWGELSTKLTNSVNSVTINIDGTEANQFASAEDYNKASNISSATTSDFNSKVYIALRLSENKYGKVTVTYSFDEYVNYDVKVTSTKLADEEVKNYEVLFSLDEACVDAQGNSLYYKNVWDDTYPFDIVLGTKSPTEVTVANPYVENDPTQEDTLTFMDYGPVEDILDVEINSTISGYPTETKPVVEDEVNSTSNIAWSKFEVYEDRQVPMLSDFGTPNVGGNLKTLSDENHFNSIYLVSVPRNKESVAGASSWDDIDLGNSRRYAVTPFAQTTNLGFIANIAPTTQYIETLVTNMLSGREFEAVAGSTTGIVSYSKLTKAYTKADREKLLDLKINTITYREVDGYAMINDDLTGLVMNNPFKEEFNRRLGVRIAQDTNTLMQQFKFKLNTPALRDTIESVLYNYFDTSSFKDKLADYQVICNDSNNSPALQAQNKVAVTVNIAFYYSAKYIEVVNNIYSVGQSFEE